MTWHHNKKDFSVNNTCTVSEKVHAKKKTCDRKTTLSATKKIVAPSLHHMEKISFFVGCHYEDITVGFKEQQY